ncbi:hypothetical protein E2C01_098748 [Portunus trituberculatus]|uniref:Uncharacterized protein n=1 Tax=Portunus trituberculatus TaxID=210409 RepID=A0A5B7KEY1_PORTR|nr:hypothetical protein [Portunus trituberculatus]
MSPLQPAWNTHRVSVDIQSLHQPKRDWCPHVLQDMFMTKLSKYPHVQAIHVYCDGQAALYALQSTSPMACDLVNKCLDLIHTLEGAGAMVHFI